MGFKQQYHASSGKAKFEPGPKKAMTFGGNVDGDPCGCSPTPKYIDVTLSGLVLCCYGFTGQSTKIASTLNGTWRLTYDSKTDDVCKWINDHDLQRNWWLENDTCTGEPYQTNAWEFRLQLLLDTVANTVEIQWYNIEQPGQPYPCMVLFQGSADVASNCVDATINNNLTVCEQEWGTCPYVPFVFIAYAKDGTAVIAQI